MDRIADTPMWLAARTRPTAEAISSISQSGAELSRLFALKLDDSELHVINFPSGVGVARLGYSEIREATPGRLVMFGTVSDVLVVDYQHPDRHVTIPFLLARTGGDGMLYQGKEQLAAAGRQLTQRSQ